MTIWIIAAVLALGDLALAYYLHRERARRRADNQRSQKCLEWWRSYAGHLQRREPC